MTVRAEIIHLLDGVSMLGGRAFADERPEAEPLPHAVVLDAISVTPALAGDGRAMYWGQLVQVDLWEDAAAASQVTSDAVVSVLNGVPISGSLRLKVESANRVYEGDRRLAHTVIQVRARRPS